MKIIDVSAAALIGLIAAVFLMMSGDLGRTAAMFPKILSIAIIGLVALYIGVQIFIQLKKTRGQSSGREDERTKGGTEGFPRSGRWHVIIGFIVVYMGLIDLIGFGVASFLFGMALPYFGGYRKMKVVVPVSLGMTIGLVFIGWLFNIPLPQGQWITLFQ